MLVVVIGALLLIWAMTFEINIFHILSFLVCGIGFCFVAEIRQLVDRYFLHIYNWKKWRLYKGYIKMWPLDLSWTNYDTKILCLDDISEHSLSLITFGSSSRIWCKLKSDGQWYSLGPLTIESVNTVEHNFFFEFRKAVVEAQKEITSRMTFRKYLESRPQKLISLATFLGLNETFYFFSSWTSKKTSLHYYYYEKNYIIIVYYDKKKESWLTETVLVCNKEAQEKLYTSYGLDVK